MSAGALGGYLLVKSRWSRSNESAGYHQFTGAECTRVVTESQCFKRGGRLRNALHAPAWQTS